MLALQAELRLAKLEELEDDDISDATSSSDSVQSLNSKVQAWRIPDPVREASGKQRRTSDKNRQSPGPQEPLPKESDAMRLEKLMARQAINKDLPNLSEEIAEWPLFYQSYRNTTQVCGFHDTENMARLQKCLEGKAQESVRALLLTDKVHQVMNILKRRFGRPEYIIRHLISRVASSPEKKEHQQQLFIEFVDTVTNFVATVESLGQPEYLNNPMLMGQLMSKLPLSRKLQWATFIQGGCESSDLKKFTSWLEDQAAIASMICDPIAVKPGKALIGAIGEPSSKMICVYCEAEHPVSPCERLKALSVNDRWKWVTDKKLCFCCLKSRHLSKDCRRKRCGKNGCSKRHYPVLHSDQKKTEESTSKTGAQPAPKTGVETLPKSEIEEIAKINVIHKRSRHVFLKVVPVTLMGPAGEVETYAFLDDGSQMSLIQDSLADELSLKGEIAPFITQWYDNTITEDPTSRRVNLKIRGTTGEEFHLRGVRTQKCLNLARETKRVDTDNWTYLKDIPLPDVMYAEPRLMIGQDFGSLITPRRTVFGKGNAPMASLTPLGWTVHGPCNLESTDTEYILHCYQREPDELTQYMRNFWSVEAFGVSSTATRLRSKDYQRAEELLNTTTRCCGGRWETGLLWRTDEETLPPSRNMAKKRFRSLEKKMDREPALKNEYHRKIQDYEDKGYARRLTNEEAARGGPRTWYLPHFVVFNPNKPGKMRIVFDAAAKSHGVSLNDRLLKGPNLLGSLVGVLFRFRERAIAMCGDIKEMFHQVMIRAEYRSSQRILGRDQKTGDLVIFEMQVMIFGSVSSPYVAQEIRNRNAKEFQEVYPEAYRVISENHYMDDYLDSVDTLPEAIERLSEVFHVHRKGGFEIRNWMRNSKELLTTLPSDALEQSGSKLALDTESFQRVLGVIWSPDSDHFTYTSVFPKVDQKIVDGEKQPTKRVVLKLVMSVFDPLGLLSVMTIRSKILMQDIWRSGLRWDQPLPEDLTSKWKTWLEDLRSATELRIPRFYALGIGQVKDIQLHIFCDASQQAFAAVAYLRLEGEHGTRSTLVTSKSRVAPLKTMTIPRLELQAAVMGTRLASMVNTERGLQISKRVFWTDSETVMNWIYSVTRRYPRVFEANRVTEILDTTRMEEWRWISTKDNVADEATRDTEIGLMFTGSPAGCGWFAP